MKNGICAKCGSAEVYDDVDKKWQGPRDAMGITVLSGAVLRNYVCTDCGYTESYIEDLSKLDEIREKWNRTGDHRQNDEA